jgi:hypothetical protein
VNPKSDRSAGLTLLETMLAVAMLAMILLVLHTALSSGVGAYRRCRETSERDSMAWTAIRLIGGDLQRLALQGPAPGAAVLLGVPEVRGQGSLLLRLRTNARAAPCRRELLVDYFFISDGPAGGSLVRRSEPLLPPGSTQQRAPLVAGETDVRPRYEVIAGGLRRVVLRYFDGQAWSDRWDAQRRAGPPELIEVTVEFADRVPGGSDILGPRGGEYTQALPVAVEAPLIRPAAEEQP